MTASDNIGIKQIKYCQGFDCTPNLVVDDSNKTITVSNGNEIMICAIGIDTSGNESNKTCSEVLKVDTIAPIFSGISDIVIDQNDTFDVNEGVSVIDSESGLSGTYTVSPTSIDTSILGTNEIVYRATDNAGNVRKITRRVIVSAEAPNISFEVIDSIPVNGWYNEKFYIKMTITDKGGSGIKASYSCVSTNSDECIPNTSFTELEKTFYIDTQGSNRICIKTIDNNNKAITLCSDVYNLDTGLPIISAKENTVIVEPGENIETSTFFNGPTYSISEGELTCNIENTSNLTGGMHEVTCTATGNNGLSASSSVTVMILEQIINYTMLYDGSLGESGENGANVCADVTGGWTTIYTNNQYGSTSIGYNTNALYHKFISNTVMYADAHIFGTVNNIPLTAHSKLGIIRTTNSNHTYTRPLVASDNHTYLSQPGASEYVSKKISLFDIVDTSDCKLQLYAYGVISGIYTENYWHEIFMTKEDNWNMLCEIINITPSTLDELLSNSTYITQILSNETAVKYMLSQCTGDFMVSAIASETFMTALESSQYKDLIYANTHWAKFLNMVG